MLHLAASIFDNQLNQSHLEPGSVVKFFYTAFIIVSMTLLVIASDVASSGLYI